jgi:hypothetical protein
VTGGPAIERFEAVADAPAVIVQTASGQSGTTNGLAAVAARFNLPWSHYVRLLSVRNPEARWFYEQEALRGGWTIKQLNRQLSSPVPRADRSLEE